MNILVTGATGFLGQQLVPLLKARGHKLAVLGRDQSRLEELFPDLECYDYSGVDRALAGREAVLHLAALNKDKNATYADYHAVNVKLLTEIAAKSIRSEVKCFVNFTTLHTFTKASSNYSITKREGVEALRAISRESINLYLPAVVGSRYSGRIAKIKSLPVPKPIKDVLTEFLFALKPTVHINSIAGFVESIERPYRGDFFIVSQIDRNMFYAFSKRAIDLSFAVLVILIFWWLMLTIWVAVKLSSKGPALFTQERIGINGQSFVCYKFRTMSLGTTQDATHKVSISSVTPIGHILRSSKLDELPQVWNILKNEISLVGPRPCLPNQIDLIEARKSRGVHRIKPGITGLAQINGVDMSDPERLATWDSRYGAQRTLLLDLAIIFASFFGRGSGDRVRK